MQRKTNKNESKRIYGSIIKLGGKRTEPFTVRLTLGYDNKGFPVYEFLDTFSNELDAELCRRDYSQNPYDIVIAHEKYSRIIAFAKLPSMVLDESKIVIEEDLSGYTFADVYKGFKELYFPAKEQIEQERLTHRKARGKLGASNAASLASAYNNSKPLHNRIYSSLTKLDFENVINNSSGKRSKLANMRNLYVKLDEYAHDKKIIHDCYAHEISIDYEAENSSRHPYTNKEIEFLWTQEDDQDVDILLTLLYSVMRIEELLSLEIANVFLDDDMMIAGIKTENGKNRRIPIHSKIKHIIEFYYNKNKDKKYLFTDEQGNKIKYDDYYRRFNQLKEEWGEDNFDQTHVIHETRHTAYSDLTRHGADETSKNLIVGHSLGTKKQNNMNDVYGHREDWELKETIELITYKTTKIVEYKNEEQLSKVN